MNDIPLYFRFMDIALTILEIKGVDAKALRAFRVLRPLRFLSGIPSKSTTFHLAKFLRLTNYFKVLPNDYQHLFIS